MAASVAESPPVLNKSRSQADRVQSEEALAIDVPDVLEASSCSQCERGCVIGIDKQRWS